MLTDPLTLIDQTIDNLETLAAVLADEFDERVYSAESANQGMRIYRIAHKKIGTLLPALRAARVAQEELTRAQFQTRCINCD